MFSDDEDVQYDPPFRTAIDFDAVNDHIRVDGARTILTSSGFTVLCAVKTTATASQSVFTAAEAAVNSTYWTVYMDTTTKKMGVALVQTNHVTNQAAVSVLADGVVNDGAWHRFGASDSNGSLVCVTNQGTEATGSYTFANGPLQYDDVCSIGSLIRASPTFYWGGRIGYVVILKEALTAAQIRLCNAPVTGLDYIMSRFVYGRDHGYFLDAMPGAHRATHPTVYDLAPASFAVNGTMTTMAADDVVQDSLYA